MKYLLAELSLHFQTFDTLDIKVNASMSKGEDLLSLMDGLEDE